VDVLNERSQKVLRAVVQSYIDKAEPVGSRYLARKYGFKLSPATIRNTMADLEDMGFLMQPHTSAGRIPTDKGYRYYVDTLKAEEFALDRREMYILKKKFEAIRHDMINELLGETAGVVSEVSHNLVFAIPLKAESTTLNRIQLYRYRNRQIVAVILTNEGLINNKILDTDFGLSQKELNGISDYLNSEFSGYAIEDVRGEIVRQMSRERQKCDILISKAISICSEVLNFPAEELIMSGIQALLGKPEFSDRINAITSAIEDKRRLIELLDGLSETLGVTVVIGSENPETHLHDMSIITAQYRQDGRPLGSVGMIGSTRMDYSRAIPIVDIMARFVSAAISR
jgi:heat-inducible transcriptional repressor